MYKATKKSLVIAALGGLMAVGCSDTSGPGGSGMSLSVAIPQPGSAGQNSLVPVTDAAGNTLDITLAEMIVSEIEFETAESDCEQSTVEDECHEFNAGPLFLTLPVNGGMLTIGTQAVPFDSIHQVELEIERPDEDDNATAALRAAHPTFPRTASVHIAGTYNGQAFDVYLSPEAELELEFQPPLPVSAVSNVTIQINVTNWFRNVDGNFIDPRSLASSSAARERVNANVQFSFDAFEDSDRDGRDD
ncbi:MAG TPA: hypothetical protein VGD27_03120 [Longimicrobiales bacterium]